MTKQKLDNTPRIKLVAEEEAPSEELVETRSFVGHSQHRSRQTGETYCCAFSPGGELLAWSNGHGFVEVGHFPKASSNPADSENGDQTSNQNWYNVIDCARTVLVMEFSPLIFDFNGNNTYALATGLDCGRVKLWNPVSGVMLLNLSDHRLDVNGLSFTRSGEPLMISCSKDQTIKVWDLADLGNMSLTITGHPLAVLDCAFSPVDPMLICSVGQAKTVFIWKLHHKRKAEKWRQLRGHHNDVSSCAWSPDGALVATASFDTKVILWDPHNGFNIMELGHMNPQPEQIFAGGANGAWLTCVSFSPDGTQLSTLCEDGKLRLWHLWSDRPTGWKLLNKPGTVCRFSPSGSAIALGKADGTVSVLDAKASVMPLRHLSRLAIRRALSPSEILSRSLPPFIKKYLHYMTSRY